MSDYYPDIADVLPLFRKTDPPTSKAAAVESRGARTGQAAAVLEALRQGPAGQTEIGQRCGLLPHQANKRLADLKRLGLAEPTGELVTNAGGYQEREWRAKDEY